MVAPRVSIFAFSSERFTRLRSIRDKYREVGVYRSALIKVWSKIVGGTGCGTVAWIAIQKRSRGARRGRILVRGPEGSKVWLLAVESGKEPRLDLKSSAIVSGGTHGGKGSAGEMKFIKHYPRSRCCGIIRALPEGLVE